MSRYGHQEYTSIRDDPEHGTKAKNKTHIAYEGITYHIHEPTICVQVEIVLCCLFSLYVCATLWQITS